MGIWVRSQDKTRLVLCEEFYVGENADLACFFEPDKVFFIKSHEGFLAWYKDEAEALKVLDSIQHAIQSKEVLIELP